MNDIADNDNTETEDDPTPKTAEETETNVYLVFEYQDDNADAAVADGPWREVSAAPATQRGMGGDTAPATVPSRPKRDSSGQRGRLRAAPDVIARASRAPAPPKPPITEDYWHQLDEPDLSETLTGSPAPPGPGTIAGPSSVIPPPPPGTSSEVPSVPPPPRTPMPSAKPPPPPEPPEPPPPEPPESPIRVAFAPSPEAQKRKRRWLWVVIGGSAFFFAAIAADHYFTTQERPPPFLVKKEAITKPIDDLVINTVQKLLIRHHRMARPLALRPTDDMTTFELRNGEVFAKVGEESLCILVPDDRTDRDIWRECIVNDGAFPRREHLGMMYTFLCGPNCWREPRD